MAGWGVFRFYTGGQVYAGWAVLAGAGILIMAWVRPSALKLFHRAWMAAAKAIGWVMSRIILTIVFYGLVTPISMVTMVLGKNFLDLKIDRARESYWIYSDDDDEERDNAACERQF